MTKFRYILALILVAGLIIPACQQVNPDETPNNDTPQKQPQKPAGPDDIIPEGRVIPAGMASLPCVYINTPDNKEIDSREVWVELATIEIKDKGSNILLRQDSLKIKGRGNSTWWEPKKPYSIKLDHKANLIGTGKSKRWALIANHMDRTLLRHVVAYEASRLTSIDWTPSGQFVELYLNGTHLGNYWLGEKIRVEESRMAADYLYSLDTSDPSEADFYSSETYAVNSSEWEVPVEVKYPDRDDYPDGKFADVVKSASKILKDMGEAIPKGDLSLIDIDSFCDWYLVHELTNNYEPNHPKSCFFHWKSGKMYAGPVWDFDWYTFIPNQPDLGIKNSLWYGNLLSNSTFTARLKERWATLKPKFETLPDFIDTQADIIRESEAVNHEIWPIDGMSVNEDGLLSFQESLDRMKGAITQRISTMDNLIQAL